MKKKTIAALAAGGALLLAAVVIGVLSLVRGYFILLPPTHMQLNGRTEEHIAALKAALKDAEYVRPAPECLDLLPAATEKEAFFLPADATHGAVLAADGDLEDKLSDAMDDEWPMVALKLASWADVDALADYQYMIRKPLCLICDDAELLEAGLRAYQGRALYEGNLTEDALAPLVEKYGLLV